MGRGRPGAWFPLPAWVSPASGGETRVETAVLDWDDLRFFLAVVRTGSLSAAARELRVTQSTVGRRLASLEGNLGARLLHRTPDGYVPTLAGEAILGRVERVEAEALAVERAVGGRDAQLQGVVRVTAVETLASHVLAPCFCALQSRSPEGTVKLNGAWRAESGPAESRNELASRHVALCRVSVPGRGHQPGGLVVLPFPTQPAHGRGDAGSTGHRRQP